MTDLVTESSTGAAWADLVPVNAGERVRLPAELDDAATAFTERGAVISPTAASRLHRMTPEAPPAADPPSMGGIADVVVVLGRLQTPVEEWLTSVGDGGRLVVLAHNRHSPLGVRRRGEPNRETPLRLDPTLRKLESSPRISAVHPIALFPDLESPTSAYRMDLPAIAQLVLGAAAVGAGRMRRFLLGALGRGARLDVARHAPPAWMIVAHVAETPAPLTPTGRIGVAANEQGVVLLGEGPDQIEKRYRDEATADRVSDIHHELAEAGIDIAGAVRSRPSPTRLRFDFLRGNDIDESRLDDAGLARWSAEAAAVLGRIHGATRRNDGTVMTHGDYWLGALIADGDEVVGVIDWTDGGRGVPEVDIDVLTTAVRDRSTLDAADRARILGEMAKRYEEAGGPTGLFTRVT